MGARPKSDKPDHHICFTCKVEKPKSEFYSDASRPLGHDGSCIECKRIKKGRTRRNKVGGKECMNCKRVKLMYDFPSKGYVKGVRQEYLDVCKNCYYSKVYIPKGLKKCTKCSMVKGLASFCINNKYRDLLETQCRQCRNERNKQYKPQSETARRSYLWTTYRTTLERYNEMLEEQNGMCKFPNCGETNSYGKPLFVDHNHNCCPGAKSCGKCVRWLLCGWHNSMLGFSRDKVIDLLDGVWYLDQ